MAIFRIEKIEFFLAKLVTKPLSNPSNFKSSMYLAPISEYSKADHNGTVIVNTKLNNTPREPTLYVIEYFL